MSKPKALCVTIALSLLVLTLAGGLTACGKYNLQSNQSQIPAGADAALPRSVAEAPVTLNVPRRSQQPPLFQAHIVTNQTVRFYSNATWSGRTIDVYFIPRQNVWQDGNHYDLKSAHGLQRVARTVIRPDGTWTVEWKATGAS